jgi:hypothetical protein
MLSKIFIYCPCNPSACETHGKTEEDKNRLLLISFHSIPVNKAYLILKGCLKELTGILLSHLADSKPAVSL